MMPITAFEYLCNSMSYKFGKSEAERELGQTCTPRVEISKTYGVDCEGRDNITSLPSG